MFKRFIPNLFASRSQAIQPFGGDYKSSATSFSNRFLKPKSIRKTLFLVQVSFIRAQKLKILITFISLFVTSIVISMLSIFPICLENYSKSLSAGLGPYQSFIQYTNLPNNLENEFINGQSFTYDENNQTFNFNDKNVKKQIGYTTFASNEPKQGFNDPNNYINIQAWLSYLDNPSVCQGSDPQCGNFFISFANLFGHQSGTIFNYHFLNQIDQTLKTFSDQTKWVHNNFGLVFTQLFNADDEYTKTHNIAESITDAIKKNIPNSTNSDLDFNHNFFLTPGMIPYNPTSEETYVSLPATVANARSNNFLQTNAWGISASSRLPFTNVIYQNGLATNKVVISAFLANKLNLHVGDEITLNGQTLSINYNGEKAIASNFSYQMVASQLKWSYSAGDTPIPVSSDNFNLVHSDIPPIKMVVGGISNNYVQAFLFGAQSLINSQYGYPKDYFNAKFSMLTTPYDIANLNVSYSDLLGGYNFIDFVANDSANIQTSINFVFYPAIFQATINHAVQLAMIALIIIFSIVLSVAMIMIMVTSNMIIQDNRKYIAIMKLLGFTHRESFKAATRVFLYITIFAFICAFPIAIGLMFALFQVIFATTGLLLVVSLPWWIAFIDFGAILCFYLINNLFNIYTVRRIKPVEIVKIDG